MQIRKINRVSGSRNRRRAGVVQPGTTTTYPQPDYRARQLAGRRYAGTEIAGLGRRPLYQ